MGRKIPARKHRGVKDPEKQREARFASIKNKINHPPTHPDEQDIPKRFLELKKSIDKAKLGKPKKRPANIHNDKELIDTRKFRATEVNLPGMRRPEKPVPVFKQRPDEEPHQFVHRIQMKCQDVINECNFENKFKVNVNRNRETGEVESINKLPKNEVAFLKFLTPHGTNKEKSRSTTKREKRKQKAMEKIKVKQEKNVDEFAKYKDEVKFGEVVHGPPQLSILPRKSSIINDDKPGRRNLLLKELLPTSKSESRASVFANKAGSKDKKKKKSLPAAEQRMIEARRVEAVQAYRMLKAKQMKATHVKM